MDFAGQPVIGTGHAIFRQLLPGAPGSLDQQADTLSIETKAGTVAISYDRDAGTVAADVPHNIHIHANEAPQKNILDTQPALTDAAASLKDSYPTVSVVKGVTYALVDLSQLPDSFAKVSAGKSPAVPLDNGWGPSFVGTMFYRASEARVERGKKVQCLRVRMVAIDLEDPACGSGCCTLGAYLALQDGARDGKYTFCFDQGAEIGRDSNLMVDIELDGQGTRLSTMRLAGQTVPVTQGTIFLPE